MANDMGEFLDTWVNKVEESMKLSAEDKAKITGAGAEAFSQVLHDRTPRSNEIYKRGRSAGHANAKHGNSHRKTKHLQDTITYKAGYTADKTHTGDTDVGYENKYYDFLAKIVNNGQHHMSEKRYANMHFLDKAQQEAKKAVKEAELKAYKEVMNHDSSK
ncbi:phage tail protein [Lactobacillus johnsonii]|uniref:phage tail protein n=1 Tax=Lactobacillus johnsonii TaxID=33959 RepID=UPI0022E97B25|nr:phage tail protein [Lactobacillus johnsonii]